MSWWKFMGYLVWSVSIPMGIVSAKELKIWNSDVYINGMGAGLLLGILMHKLITCIEHRLRTSESSLEERQTKLLRQAWRTANEHRKRTK
jgi:xanthine/uracil permease